MTQGLRDPIKEFLCDHRDLEKLIAGFKSGLGKGAPSKPGEATSNIAQIVGANKSSKYDF